jgi:hypothetical protein
MVSLLLNQQLQVTPLKTLSMLQAILHPSSSKVEAVPLCYLYLHLLMPMRRKL